MAEPIRTLIVDDDPLARKRMRRFLGGDPEIEIVGEAADGAAALEILEGEELDLLFLDVQMPQIDGFGVVDRLRQERMPSIVFASAHVEYAVRAFEACALDYLLKPFDQERFALALARAKTSVRMRSQDADPRISALLDFVQHPARPAYPEVLAIKVGDQYRFTPVSEIRYVTAEDNYVRLHLGGSERLLHKTLTEMESQILDPATFLRIHRSTLVNVSQIAAAEPLFHGEYSVILQDGTRLVCSRRYRPKLQERARFMS